MTVMRSLRKASSRSLAPIVLGSKRVVVVKICGSGQKRTSVPVWSLGRPSGMGAITSPCAPSGTPRSYSCLCSLPFRHTVTSSFSESALVTLAPTPCSPPLTL